jgi:hypothetical protein
MSIEDFAQSTGQSVDDAEALEAGLREVQVDELDLQTCSACPTTLSSIKLTKTLEPATA